MSDLKVDGITAATANTAVTIKGLGTGKVVLGDGNLVFPDADGAAGTFITTNGSAALSFSTAGKIVQVVNTQTGAVATGTTVTVLDDSIPQNTEGNEFMTLAITPTSASNKLIIQASATTNTSVAGRQQQMNLFQDSTASALASTLMYHETSGGYRTNTLSHYMAAGTTSATTFKIRIGNNNTGTVTLNGISGGRALGGAFSSFITITEISV